MAEEKKNTVAEKPTTPKKDEKVETMIPFESSDPNESTQEFFSVNGKNYIIQKGVKVRVPAFVKEVIDNSQEAKRKARENAAKRKLRDPMQEIYKN